MTADSLPPLGMPALLRDGDGRLVALRALPDASLLALARFFADEEPDLHLAVVRDALAQGAVEDEARALLDLDSEELRLRAEPSWASALSEISRRGLPRPEIRPSPPRDLAEIDGLLIQAALAGQAGPPASLVEALVCRAGRRAAGGASLPLAWVDWVRRHDGLRLGGLRLLRMAEVDSALPLGGWTPFGSSRRGAVLHAVDAGGTCAAWLADSLREGVFSGQPALSAPDLVSYLEILLPRALDAAGGR